MKIYAETNKINAYFTKSLMGLKLDLTKTDKDNPADIPDNIVEAFKNTIANNKYIHIVEDKDDNIKIVEKKVRGNKVIKVRPNNKEIYFDVRDKSIELGYDQKLFGRFSLKSCSDYIDKYRNDDKFREEANLRLAQKKLEKEEKLKYEKYFKDKSFMEVVRDLKKEGYDPKIHGNPNKENVIKYLKASGK